MELKSKGMWLGCGTPAAVTGILVLLLGLYFVGGYGMAGGIIRGYEDGNCQPAVQLGQYLERFYPQAIAPFAEQALLNSEECLLYTQASVHEDAGEYELACQAYEAYVKAYPDGKFAEQAAENTVMNFLKWGQELHEQKKYGDAIKKLDQAASLVSVNNVALTREIQDCLCSAYMDWAVTLLSQKDFPGAIGHYKTASVHANRLAEKDSISEAIVSAYLDWAQDLSRRDSFHEAFQKIELARSESKDKAVEIRVNQASQDIVQAFSKSSDVEAKKEMEIAVSAICLEKTVSLPIFALNPNEKKFSSAINLPTGLQAKTPETLHYVVCRSVSERKIQTCGPYTSTSQPWLDPRFLTRHYIERYVIDWEVRVHHVVSGRVLARETFTGASPRACRNTENISTKKLTGTSPEIKVLHDWLSKLRLP